MYTVLGLTASLSLFLDWRHSFEGLLRSFELRTHVFLAVKLFLQLPFPLLILSELILEHFAWIKHDGRSSLLLLMAFALVQFWLYRPRDVVLCDSVRLLCPIEGPMKASEDLPELRPLFVLVKHFLFLVPDPVISLPL